MENCLTGVNRRAFILTLLLLTVGCGPWQAGDDADSVDRDASSLADSGIWQGSDVTGDGRLDSYVSSDIPTGGVDALIPDVADIVDGSEEFVCQRPAGQDWVTFEIQNCGWSETPGCVTWTLERSSMLLAYPDSYGVEDTCVLPEDKFLEIDCIISSIEFQDMMDEGFDCPDTMVVDSYFDFSLTLADETTLGQDVTSCVYDSETLNLARVVRGKVIGWYIEAP